jgi:hypothetical protein
MKGIRLGYDIVAMLSRRASANWFPLGFLWWAKNFGVMRALFLNEGFEQHQTNSGDKYQADNCLNVQFH